MILTIINAIALIHFNIMNPNAIPVPRSWKERKEEAQSKGQGRWESLLHVQFLFCTLFLGYLTIWASRHLRGTQTSFLSLGHGGFSTWESQQGRGITGLLYMQLWYRTFSHLAPEPVVTSQMLWYMYDLYTENYARCHWIQEYFNWKELHNGMVWTFPAWKLHISPSPTWNECPFLV